MGYSFDRSWLFSYEFRGARYSLEIPASSAAEAQMKLAKMADATFDGEVKMTVPATRPTQFLARIKGGWRSRSR